MTAQLAGHCGSNLCKADDCCSICWQVVTERAVAVIGNLSTSSEYFGALREAGSLQRLVRRPHAVGAPALHLL